MFALFMLLVTDCGVNAQEHVTPAPPYVQSRMAFAHARSYLEEKVPFDTRNISHPETRNHLAFGILVEVTRIMVRNYMNQDRYDYDPLNIINDCLPRAWKDYNIVSNIMKRLLAEAQFKINTVTTRMDMICSITDSVEDCNFKVHEKLKQSINFVKHSAEILLALGDVSRTLIKHEEELNFMARRFTVVPYILKHVETPAFEQFVDDLTYALYLIRKEVSIP